MQKRVRAAFVGWGAIYSRVGALLAQRKTAADIVGIAAMDTPEARAALPAGARFLASPDEPRSSPTWQSKRRAARPSTNGRRQRLLSRRK